MGFLQRVLGGEAKREPGEPTLAEAWHLLAPRYGATVEERDVESVLVRGTVRGRPFVADIAAAKKWNEALIEMNADPRRRRAHRDWHTELVVACANPRGLAGSIKAFKDLNDPAWDPRNFDPTHCRKVVADDPAVAASLVPVVAARLLPLWSDVQLVVDANSVRVLDDSSSAKDIGFVGGSLIHQPVGPVVPWPDRALVGPQWWLELLCDLADAVDLTG